MEEDPTIPDHVAMEAVKRAKNLDQWPAGVFLNSVADNLRHTRRLNQLQDAVEELGSVTSIRAVFTGFQRFLYEPQPEA